MTVLHVPCYRRGKCRWSILRVWHMRCMSSNVMVRAILLQPANSATKPSPVDIALRLRLALPPARSSSPAAHECKKNYRIICLLVTLFQAAGSMDRQQSAHSSPRAVQFQFSVQFQFTFSSGLHLLRAGVLALHDQLGLVGDAQERGGTGAGGRPGRLAAAAVCTWHACASRGWAALMKEGGWVLGGSWC
jgi:hypothetical protein